MRVERSTVIDAPIEAVWAVLRDFNSHTAWHPVIAESHIEAPHGASDVGAVRAFSVRSGERLREQLIALNDRDHSMRYTIVDSDIPLLDYVAEKLLKPVTDGVRTFFRWRSSFRTPPGRERELAELVASGVYEAGFEGLRKHLAFEQSGRRPLLASLPPVQAPRSGGFPADGAASRAPSRSVARSRTAASAGVPATEVRLRRHGGPEQLEAVKTKVASPARGEVRIAQHAVGVNFIDVYCRTGHFDLLARGGVPGMEAAGVVTDIGPGVTTIRPGARVAYAGPPLGAYASVRNVAADMLVALPDALDFEHAAAVLLKGITASFLLHDVHALRAGETALVFAPAGGVGRLLVQWATRLGATVIGATSSETKARVARSHGAQHVITPGEQSLEAQVVSLTHGRGVDVVFDAVGRDSFAHSLASLAPRGHLVSYGQASGPVGVHDIGALASRSITVSRPNYAHYTDTRAKLELHAGRLFQALRERIVTAEVGQTLALAQAAEAHRRLESRETTGALVLLPEGTRT